MGQGLTGAGEARPGHRTGRYQAVESGNGPGGVACLRARGYRSAELYLSSAMTRHRSLYAVTHPLQSAQQEAIRISRRGVGPARGKQPIPMPSPHAHQFEPLAVGIWFLLRVSELTALNVEDVCQRQGARLQAGLWINRSKTDQEEVGVLVSRDCVCEDPAAAPWCPAHLLWKVVCSRKDMMHEMGTVSGKAPLFTDAEGKRLTASGVKKQCGWQPREQACPPRPMGHGSTERTPWGSREQSSALRQISQRRRCGP